MPVLGVLLRYIAALLLFHSTIVTGNNLPRYTPHSNPPTNYVRKTVNAKVNTTALSAKVKRSLVTRQSNYSQIGLQAFSQQDCNSNGVTWLMDDLTKTPEREWVILANSSRVTSFQLVRRDLQGQEQLDISTFDNGDPCGRFIASYFADSTGSCNNWGNSSWGSISCFRYWINPGL